MKYKMIPIEDKLRVYLTFLKQKVNHLDYDVKHNFSSSEKMLDEIKIIIEDLQNLLER